ncbi:MAG TPA: phosphatase PAP2 family protein [Rhizomicrobium sp.]|jgi:membrane-associated phospholipid phosphatase|nr:phosphatase PAP2 family protein [Rhizomicrobium sp.]
MHKRLQSELLALAALIVALDVAWLWLGHFNIDAAPYSVLLLAVPPLAGASLYYGNVRREEAISVMFSGAAFLSVFSAACNLLSYLALTVAGPRIDMQLAAIDHALGFDWPALMMFASEHGLLTKMLLGIYQSVMPQTVLLLLLLGWKKQSSEIYGFCLAIAFGAAITVGFWTMFPSFGAFSVFNLPPQVAARLGLALSGDYGHALVEMLKNGPGIISPADMRGIVGFPSYHTVQAIALTWYARKLRYVGVAAFALNGLVLFAALIHGGHHLVDIAGGAAVAAVAIICADRRVLAASRSNGFSKVGYAATASQDRPAPAG